MADYCEITGTLRKPEQNALAADAAIHIHRASKAGANMVIIPFRAISDDLGVVTFRVPKACTIYVSGRVDGLWKDASGNRYNEDNPKALAVPDADTATLESLVAVAAVPSEGLTVQDEGTPLATLIGTLNVTGAAGSIAQTAPGVAALSFNSMVNSLAGLSAPGGDRIAFYDQSASALQWLQLGTNLSITGTTLNATGGGGGASALDDLTDVVITSPATGAFLRYDGADWIDAVLVAGDIPDLSATYSPLAHVHTFNSLTSKPTTISGYGITDAWTNPGSGANTERFGAGATTNDRINSLAIMGEVGGGDDGVAIGPGTLSWGGKNFVGGSGAQMQSGGQGTIVGYNHLGLGGEATGYGALGQTGFGSFNFGYANHILPAWSGIGIGDNVWIVHDTPANAVASIGIGGGLTIGHKGVIVMGWGSDTAHTTPITTADYQFLMGLNDTGNPTHEGIRELIIGKGPTLAAPLSVRIHPTDASGTNISSTGHLRLEGSRPTGTGTGSSVIIATAPPTTSGSSLAPLVDRITVPSTGQISFSGADAGGGFGLVIPKDGKLGMIKLGSTSPNAYFYKIFNSASYRGVGVSYNAKLDESSAAYEVDSAAVAQGVFEYDASTGWTFYTAAASQSLALAGTINNTQEWGIGGAAVSGQRLTVRGKTSNASAYALLVQNSAPATIISVRNDKNVGINYDGWGTNAVGVISVGNGTAPTTSPADAFQIWSADINAVAGQAGAHFRNEINTAALILPGVRYKTDTGDPTDSFEGMIVINTFDNTLKVYADGGLRTIATW